MLYTSPLKVKLEELFEWNLKASRRNEISCLGSVCRTEQYGGASHDKDNGRGTLCTASVRSK